MLLFAVAQCHSRAMRRAGLAFGSFGFPEDDGDVEDMKPIPVIEGSDNILEEQALDVIAVDAIDTT